MWNKNASGFFSFFVSKCVTMNAKVACFSFWVTLNVLRLASAFWISFLLSEVIGCTLLDKKMELRRVISALRFSSSSTNQSWFSAC